MAWVTEYDMTWHSEGLYGDVFLQRDGGTYQMPLKLKRGSLILKDSLPNWEDPIVRKNCVFTIVNDLSDFYELLPLMTISNGQIKVVVTVERPSYGTTILFEGYLNCEAVSQNMVNNANINLTASGLVDKLQWDAPESIKTVQDMSLIDIIADCLAMTGAEHNIIVYCPLYEASAPLGSGDSMFNLTAVSTELFWVDNIDQIPALDILRWILGSVDCFLYWHREAWYIIHYESMGALSNSYVEYTFGTSYDYATPGTPWGPYNRDQKDVHTPDTRPQLFGSQMLAVNPGYKQVDISLDQKQYFNQLNGDLSDIVENNVNPTWVPLRTWHALYGGWDSTWQGWPAGPITNALSRTGTYDVTSDDGVLNGLTTHFKVTISTETQLTIKWKIYVKTPPSPYSSHFWSAPEDMKVVFNWYLRVAYGDYLRFDEEQEDPELAWITHAVMIPNTLTIRGTDFDQELKVYEGQFVIPVGDLLSAGDVSFIFRMGTELVTDEVSTGPFTWTDQPMDKPYYGDFHAAITENPEDNLLEGGIVTDFLDEKTVTIQLFDGGWSYRNSLKQKGTDASATDGWFTLTSSWSYDGTDFNTLARKLMQSKFRLYRVARQKIKVQYDVTSPEAYDEWYPLSLFYDNKQSDKKFVVAYQARRLDEDSITVELWEYDDTEIINLT